MRDLSVLEVNLHQVEQRRELREDEHLVTCLYELGQHAIEQLELARGLEDVVRNVLGRVALEQIGMVTDLAQLHDGIG